MAFNLLGRVLLQGQVGPGASAIDPAAVAGFGLLHLAAFILSGLGLALLVHLAQRNIALRMGVWLGIVVAFCFLSGLILMLDTSTGERLPLWTLLGGNAVGVGLMGGLLWRRHPRLRESFGDAPLGDEVRAPPHASGGPQV